MKKPQFDTEMNSIEESAPLVSANNLELINRERGFYGKPRFDYPKILESWLDDGYLFGNQNGRSIYNMILEGACAFSFLSLLFYSLYNFKRDSTEINSSWQFLYLIPLIKNLSLIPDFILLKRKQRYSFLSLVVLCSNICVWAFAYVGYSRNKHIIFENLRAKSDAERKPNEFTGIFRVVLIDNYIQLSLLFYFIYQFFKGERGIDFYRDYYNPLNFCLSSSANAVLQSIMTLKRSTILWYLNFVLILGVGLYFIFIYFVYLYNLFIVDSKFSKIITIFGLLSLPFLAAPFCLFGFACIKYLESGRRKSMMLYSVGSLAYFSLVWLLWSISAMKKSKHSLTVQDLSFISRRKIEDILQKKSYQGSLNTFNPSFFPTEIRLEKLVSLEKKNEKIVQECFICFKDQPNCFFRKCGHGGLCTFCAEDLQNFDIRCPICAGEINEIVVYSTQEEGYHIIDTITKDI